MNFPRLADLMWQEDRYGTRLVFNFNEKGFRVNPSLEAVARAIETHRGRDIYVMSVYSGMGDTPPAKFLAKHSSIKGVLFGSSSPERIRENFRSLAGDQTVTAMAI